MNELEQKFADLLKQNSASVDTRIKAIEDAVAKGVSKEQLETLEKALKDDLAKLGDVQKQFDELAVEMKKLGTAQKAGELVTFNSALRKAFDANKDKFKAMSQGDLKSFAVEIELKADMTEAANFSGRVVPFDRVPGVVFDPTRLTHVRDFIPVAGTISNAISYNQETAYTDGAATIAEAATFGNTDFTLTEQTANVRKIGTYARVTNEMFEDFAQLIGYLNARLPGKVMNQEDAQILYGTGVAPQIAGIKNNLGNGNFTGAGGFVNYFALNKSSYYDILAIAINQIELVEYRPNAIMVNPSDYMKLAMTKDANGQYIYPSDIRLGGQITVDGVPVVKNTSVTAGDFFVGDFATGCQLFEKRALIMEFAREDADNFTKDRTTVRISERVALAVYRDNAFVMDTFAAAKLVIEAV